MSGRMLATSVGTATSASASGSGSQQQSIRQAKRALRKHMAVRLSELGSENVAAQSRSVTEHVLRHPLFQRARNVSIYVSMSNGEIRTEELCRQTLLLGKRLYVPRFALSTSTPAADMKNRAVDASVPTTKFDSDMRMLRVQDWSDFEAMVMNKWGIREPIDTYGQGARENALDVGTGGRGLDLIVVPGVAFDTFGGRLGHGKGYYDRYIQRATDFNAQQRRQQNASDTSLNDDAPPSTIALALQEQILSSSESVPRDEYDLPMNLTMTSDGPLTVHKV